METSKVKYIVTHSSATPPSMDIGAKEIRKWHVDERGWKDIGYHFIIRRDGTLELGRPLNVAGAHARGYNKESIGVCMIGGVDENGNASPEYTFEQWLAWYYLNNILKRIYTNAEVVGHNNLSDTTECPSFDAKERWNTYG